jgi:hypothetical protein
MILSGLLSWFTFRANYEVKLLSLHGPFLDINVYLEVALGIYIRIT